MKTMLAYLYDKFDPMEALGPALNWKSLGLFNLYRLLLSSLFLAWAVGEDPPLPLGEYNHALFFALSTFYFTFSLICGFAAFGREQPLERQLHVQVLVDILVITLIMHTSGGVGSGLGILLIVTVAGGSILSTGRSAVFFAAIATLVVLTELSYSHLISFQGERSYTQAGLLGVTFFGTALLAHALARRTRESEALAAQRGIDLANMAQLTEYVIGRMQTGILVLDNLNVIRSMNESAGHLLGTAQSTKGQTLDSLFPDLKDQLHAWQQDPTLEPRIFRPSTLSANIMPRFAHLGTEESAGTLIFLEDTSRIAQQAQHLKLASLGRLTASIAHEIRNPLAGINHAGQLLGESDKLDNANHRLTQIIVEQSQRINRIIENIMQLSRRDRSQLNDFQLQPWLEKFVSEFTQSYNIDAGEILVEHAVQDMVVRMDPSQLHQVAWNLCQNGLRYTRQDHPLKLKLCTGILLDAGAPFLDVIDFGPGISAELAQHIFEPFFTTDASGTGLGLYISRELCECNQARLSYISRVDGSCFRIIFADPRRRQMAP